MDWGQFLVMLSAFVVLFFWNRTETRADQRQMLSIVMSIQSEIKDFHGRLEKQDAEFKAHIMNSHKE